MIIFKIATHPCLKPLKDFSRIKSKLSIIIKQSASQIDIYLLLYVIATLILHQRSMILFHYFLFLHEVASPKNVPYSLLILSPPGHLLLVARYSCWTPPTGPFLVSPPWRSHSWDKYHSPLLLDLSMLISLGAQSSHLFSIYIKFPEESQLHGIKYHLYTYEF